MQYFYYWILLFSLFISCTTTKNYSSKNIKAWGYDENKSQKVINEAKTYLGTPYKYAGKDKNGIDCSGLMFVSFQKIGIELPRKSQEQANQGISIDLNEVKPGDLLFFDTSGLGISHSGMVEKIKNDEVFFIHSSTSKGVIISSMNEPYWKSKFVVARRLIN